MGIHPKIGITGLPKSGKSAVMEKVVEMITNERKNERKSRNDRSQGMLDYWRNEDRTDT